MRIQEKSEPSAGGARPGGFRSPGLAHSGASSARRPQGLPPKVALVPADVIKKFSHTKRVGTYLLGKTLGEGSFAKVKEGMHTLTGEKVAVKVIDKKKAREDVYVRKNLRREGKLLQMVRHQNVVRLFEIMETENSYYLVTELCNGGDLMEHICNKKRLEEKETRKYIRQILSAVDYLHKLGILHRDLKVENLLLDENKNIKIIDFGLSNSVEVTHNASGSTVFHEFCVTQCGSPAYAAPELLGNNKYGPNVDIWSIGVNMFAMLTGSLPFTVEPFNIKALHKKMLKGEMNPTPEHLTKSCKDLIKRFLNPDPDARITIKQAMNHPWILEAYRKGVEDAPFPNKLDSEHMVPEIVHHMTHQLDFRSQEVIRLVSGNIPNSATATYFLLSQRLARHETEMAVNARISRAVKNANKSPSNSNYDISASDVIELTPINDQDDYVQDKKLPRYNTNVHQEPKVLEMTMSPRRLPPDDERRTHNNTSNNNNNNRFHRRPSKGDVGVVDDHVDHHTRSPTRAGARPSGGGINNHTQNHSSPSRDLSLRRPYQHAAYTGSSPRHSPRHSPRQSPRQSPRRHHSHSTNAAQQQQQQGQHPPQSMTLPAPRRGGGGGGGSSFEPAPPRGGRLLKRTQSQDTEGGSSVAAPSDIVLPDLEGEFATDASSATIDAIGAAAAGPLPAASGNMIHIPHEGQKSWRSGAGSRYAPPRDQMNLPAVNRLSRRPSFEIPSPSPDPRTSRYNSKTSRVDRQLIINNSGTISKPAEQDRLSPGAAVPSAYRIHSADRRLSNGSVNSATSSVGRQSAMAGAVGASDGGVGGGVLRPHFSDDQSSSLGRRGGGGGGGGAGGAAGGMSTEWRSARPTARSAYPHTDATRANRTDSGSIPRKLVVDIGQYDRYARATGRIRTIASGDPEPVYVGGHRRLINLMYPSQQHNRKPTHSTVVATGVGLNNRKSPQLSRAATTIGTSTQNDPEHQITPPVDGVGTSARGAEKAPTLTIATSGGSRLAGTVNDGGGGLGCDTLPQGGAPLSAATRTAEMVQQQVMEMHGGSWRGLSPVNTGPSRTPSPSYLGGGAAVGLPAISPTPCHHPNVNPSSKLLSVDDIDK